MKEAFKRLANAMHNFKLIEQEQLSQLLLLPEKENWENNEWDWLMETYYKGLDSTLINSILEEVGIAFCQDAESSQVPPPYQKSMIPMLLDFIGIDKSKAEIKLHYTKIEDGDDKYLLSITYNDKEYKRALLDSGDYYDVDGMLTIINDISIDQIKPHLLRKLPTNDQSFCYYKGDLHILNSFLSSYRNSI